MLKKLIVAFLILVLPATIVFSISTDEIYDRAAQKYLTGDLPGAAADLERVLELEPNHDKARELLTVVRKEMGVAPAPAPKPEPEPEPKPVPKPAPKPTPRPKPVPKPAPKVEEPKPAPKIAPQFVPPPSTPQYSAFESTLNQIILLFLAAAIFLVLIIARGLIFVSRKAAARRRMQVCPDCKTKNPEDAEFCQSCGTRLKAWQVITANQKKWFKKFNWKSNPFTLDVMPSLFTGYSGQINSIMEKISTRSGHILAYGEKGVGKTTMLRWLADNLKAGNYAIYIARPPINFNELIRYIVAEIKGEKEARKKDYSLYEVEALVKKAKKPVVLLMDEAHEFSEDVERQMRSLGDIGNINYILAGLPETKDKLKKESPPFFDRIILEVNLDHLTYDETKDLIRKRIENVGGEDAKPFNEEALQEIYKISRGRPRMILKVCDWIMAEAIRKNLDAIGPGMGKDFPEEAAHQAEQA